MTKSKKLSVADLRTKFLPPRFRRTSEDSSGAASLASAAPTVDDSTAPVLSATPASTASSRSAASLRPDTTPPRSSAIPIGDAVAPDEADTQRAESQSGQASAARRASLPLALLSGRNVRAAAAELAVTAAPATDDAQDFPASPASILAPAGLRAARPSGQQELTPASGSVPVSPTAEPTAAAQLERQKVESGDENEEAEQAGPNRSTATYQDQSGNEQGKQSVGILGDASTLKDAGTVSVEADITKARDIESPHPATDHIDFAQIHTPDLSQATPVEELEPLSPISPGSWSASITHRPQRIVSMDASPPQLTSRTLSAAATVDTGSHRKQSLAYSRDHQLVRTLLQSHEHGSERLNSMALERNMMYRKIWVKRPGASATLVQISEDDLVDDVRDMILKKYANSLGRSFDSPDVTLRIISREHSHSHRHAPQERVLGPEEHMTRTLDTYYPGGQTVDEALLIDVPVRRTPRQSPHMSLPYYSAAAEDMRPAETDQGYFPLIQPGGLVPSPQALSNMAASVSGGSERHGHHHQHSISVLSTGMVPPLPSPGSRTTRQGHRPRLGRNNTASPTAVTSNAPMTGMPPTSAPRREPGSLVIDSRVHAGSSIPAPLPTPPGMSQAPARTATPPPRTQSPRPSKQKRSTKKSASSASNAMSQSATLLDGTVPPINVLIVEDNIINLKLLEAFMKRLKVRWHTAMNGRDAVTKWKQGGFHLVLMDIQLPIMSGLEATKEIRRLERCNGVGVLAASEITSDEAEAVTDKDRLSNMELFKSPVIIVALTASSLQSDRHEALAAGCNDFLTKPVNFVWLERKVTEWGCMQALIDFDGWRKWKEPAAPTGKPGINTPSKAKSESSKNRTSPFQPSASAPFPESPARVGTASGSSSERSSNHSTSGAQPSDSPTTRGPPELHIQAPTPPMAAVKPAVDAPGSATAGRRPSPLIHSASASSPPTEGSASASPATSPRVAASPTGSRRTSPTYRRDGVGSSGSGGEPGDSTTGDSRRAKRASASYARGGGLTGVAEEDEAKEVAAAAAAAAARDREREVGRVGA